MYYVAFHTCITPVQVWFISLVTFPPLFFLSRSVGPVNVSARRWNEDGFYEDARVITEASSPSAPSSPLMTSSKKKGKAAVAAAAAPNLALDVGSGAAADEDREKAMVVSWLKRAIVQGSASPARQRLGCS